MDKNPPTSASGIHFNPTVSPSLQALLCQSVDYAGLFPPAELALEPAMQNHRSYVASDEAWMLNTFVLPVGKFAAATPYLRQFDRQNPIRISVLSPKTENMSDFVGKLSSTLDAMSQLQNEGDSEVSMVQLEIALPPNCDLEALTRLNDANSELGLDVFCEAAPAEAERVIELLAENNRTAKSFLGYKLRTGGVTAAAFPTSTEIACALVASARSGVPIKFTAGLHHPVRQFRDEVKTKMHGFLNVLGAGVLAAEHSWDQKTTVQMLEDEDAGAFAFDQDTFAWREWQISNDSIRARREVVTSFGSCSFDEPREDLRGLGLL
ncbi:MAG TPA: hypothetical protein VGM62_02170 [Chthoniobacterales bacterium]|jgi:hypothetical protein